MSVNGEWLDILANKQVWVDDLTNKGMTIDEHREIIAGLDAKFPDGVTAKQVEYEAMHALARLMWIGNVADNIGRIKLREVLAGGVEAAHLAVRNGLTVTIQERLVNGSDPVELMREMKALIEFGVSNG